MLGLNHHEVPAYLFGFVSALCVIALLWTVAVCFEELWRWQNERDEKRNAKK